MVVGQLLVTEDYPANRTYPPGVKWSERDWLIQPSDNFSFSRGSVVPTQDSDGGPVTGVNPTVAPSETASGEVSGSYFDLFYNRIHILPGRIEAGNVTVNTQFDLSLWNAYLTSVEMTSDTLDNTAGVTVTGGPEAPYTLGALEIADYDVTVLEDGDASVDLNPGWTINGQTYSFNLTATRIVPFFYGPNWAQPVVEDYEFKTSVSSSYSGQEQRQSTRSKPRRSWRYNLLEKEHNARNVYYDILGFQGRSFGLPVWTDKTELTSQASVGDLVLNALTENRGFVSGHIVFVRSGDLVETHEVDSVSANQITLKKPLSNNFSVGSEVYPGVVASLADSITGSHLTSRVISSSLSFNGVPQDTPDDLPVIAAANTVDGYEVIERRPNWRTPVDTLFSSPVKQIDFGDGITIRKQHRKYPQTGNRFRYSLIGKDEINEFKGILRRLKGRANAAFVNSFTEDLVLNSTATVSQTGAQFKDSSIDLAFDPAAVPTLVCFHTTLGDIRLRVESISLNQSGLIDVEFTTGFPFTITPTDVIKVSLCFLSRLASDRVSINWLTDDKVETELTFIMVSK